MVASLAMLAGCGEHSTTVDAGPSAGADAALIACTSDVECSDGLYCNGEERCQPSGSGAGVCVDGTPVVCDDHIDCTTDSCSHAQSTCMYMPPDADGDGHADMGCLGPEGEPLGDDCDDGDDQRYPGNVERCEPSDPSHDEDCDSTTFGFLDADGDGVASDLCCAEGDGTSLCGSDCDDTDADAYPEHPEICDDKDNDCDGTADVGTREVAWYPDSDGDGYGDPQGVAVMSCAPLPARSLRNTDCDDGLASVHPAAREICDRIDNDCNASVDEGGVCLCATGGRQPCACDATATGTQTCVEGAWSTCDCTECIEAARECLGDLLPRVCVDGRWSVQPACGGARNLCLAGQCVCADGTTDCMDVADVIRPFVFARSPDPDAQDVRLDAVVSVDISEAIAPGSLGPDTFTLEDAFGNRVAATVQVGGRSVILVPHAPLLDGTPYQVTLGGELADPAGNALGADVVWEFATPWGGVAETLSPGPGVTYSSPQLAMSESGVTVAAMVRETRGGDTITVASVGAMRIGGAWQAPVAVAGGHDTAATAIDSGDHAVLVLKSAQSDIFEWTAGGGWNPTSRRTFDDAFVGSPNVTMNEAGHGFASVSITVSGGERASALSWPPGPLVVLTQRGEQSPGPTISTRAGAMGPDGNGAHVWITGSDLHVARTGPGLAGWTSLPTVSTRTAGASIAVDVNGDSDALVVWTETQFNVGPYTKLRAQVVDASAAWIAAAEAISGDGSEVSEDMPRVGFDGGGNALVVYRTGEHIDAVRYSSANGWGASTRLSAVATADARDPQLAVASDGQAVAVWAQGGWFGGADDLWAARYAVGSGWSQARRVAVAIDGGSMPRLAIDGAGNAIAAYDQGGARLLDL